MAVSTPLHLTGLICSALVLAMLGNSTFPALIPLFQETWQLSASQAGWVSGLYYAGYAAAVPLLVGRTDRTDARSIFIAAQSARRGGNARLRVFRPGLLDRPALASAGRSRRWPAATWWVRASSPTELRGRSNPGRSPGYTAHFAVGIGLSVFAAGELASRFGWQAAFVFGAGGSVAAALLVWLGTAAHRPEGSQTSGEALRWLEALKSRAAMGYTLGYACHIWELFGWRAWLVTFLVAAPALGGLAQAEATRLATLALIIGLPASVLGNELSLRFGRRRRALTLMMLTSAVCTLSLGLAADGAAWLLLMLVFVVGVTAYGRLPAP